MADAPVGAAAPKSRTLAALAASLTNTASPTPGAAANLAGTNPAAAHAASPATVASADPDPFDGAFTPARLLGLLYEQARPKLTPAHRRAIVSGAAGYVSSVAQRSAVVVEGLGCLVADDGGSSGRPGPAVGAFQSADDVPTLLWHMADVLQGLSAMADVAARAFDDLTELDQQGPAAAPGMASRSAQAAAPAAPVGGAA